MGLLISFCFGVGILFFPFFFMRWHPYISREMIFPLVNYYSQHTRIIMELLLCGPFMKTHSVCPQTKIVNTNGLYRHVRKYNVVTFNFPRPLE